MLMRAQPLGLLLVASMTLLYLGASRSAPAGLIFTGLGDLPGGNVSSAAWGVSGDGKVVVGGTGFASVSRTADDADTSSFRWTAEGGMTAVATYPPSQARAISADGSVIVGYHQDVAPYANGWRWTAAGGTRTLLHPHPQGPYTPWSYAYAVSADGRVIVGAVVNLPGGASGSGAPRATRWTPESGFVELGLLPGEQPPFATATSAQGVSADGSVIVGGIGLVGGLIGWRWTQAEGVSLLQGFPGGRSTDAQAVSADGSTIVGNANDGSGRRAVAWLEDGSIVSLGPAGAFGTSAYAVSADGSVIVGSSAPAGTSDFDAFLWNESDGMRSLRDLLVEEGIDLTGWTLQQATGISADGRTIVGYGINPLGQTEGWIATIPEPATLWLPILASALASRSCRARRSSDSDRFRAPNSALLRRRARVLAEPRLD